MAPAVYGTTNVTLGLHKVHALHETTRGGGLEIIPGIGHPSSVAPAVYGTTNVTLGLHKVHALHETTRGGDLR